MKYRLFKLIRLFTVLIFLVKNLTPGYAALGEIIHLSAKKNLPLLTHRIRSEIQKQYSIQSSNQAGSSIREYISNKNDQVFGIAWDGNRHPNFSEILGEYSSEYEKSIKNKPRTQGNRHHTLKTARLVVQKWGRMRNLQGRAYDPNLLPEGVNPDEIQ